MSVSDPNDPIEVAANAILDLAIEKGWIRDSFRSEHLPDAREEARVALTALVRRPPTSPGHRWRIVVLDHDDDVLDDDPGSLTYGEYLTTWIIEEEWRP